MRTVPVPLTDRHDLSYDILIEPGLFEKTPSILAEMFSGRAVALIADSNVGNLYGRDLSTVLRGSKFRLVESIQFPAGEASKCRKVKEELEDRMFTAGMGRDSLVVALGGGVTGDLAGYVAATFNRGVPLVQVPTSLLAMADSSVGGKTGIDVPWGKNLLGAFHQPALVLIDPRVLNTLPERELKSGMAEVVKHGVIRDADLFGYIEDNLDKILGCDEETMTELVARNCLIKADVVSRDERESNLRQILNFGHTLGHAVEAFTRFGWLHGEALACGMAVEAELAVRLELMAAGDRDRITALLRRLGLPVGLGALDVSAGKLLELTRLDKKARGGRARYALAAGVGGMAANADGSYGIDVDEDLAVQVLIDAGAQA
ncbi:MAG: 3-dehydroquinate synthase [Candidatus Glassbacteria bacterium]|nr:3-dehydroquinate synthase [Candidatus Glassbacteria bacterium]